MGALRDAIEREARRRGLDPSRVALLGAAGEAGPLGGLEGRLRAAGGPPELIEALVRAHALETRDLPPPTTREPARLPRPGERVGPYLVEAELGRGQMGVVYRARAGDGRSVAVKLLLGAGVLDASRRARFRREAEALLRLAHPALVHLLSYDPEAHPPWLAMELVEGRSLDRLLPDLTPAQGARIVLELARGLGHAHAHGVVHRDVKPGNVLVRPDGSGVLTDFGLARDLGAESITQSGVVLGTPLYIPPEAFRGEEHGPAGDVWALGLILYEALAGEHPCHGLTLLQLHDRVLQEGMPPPSTVRSVDPGLERVALRALERDPTRRYPDGLALARALEEALGVTVRRAPRSRAPLAGILAGAAVAAAFLAWWRPTPSPEGPSPVALPGWRIELQHGPLRGRDSYVRGDGYYGNDNFGCEIDLRVGRREGSFRPGAFRSLLAFDPGPAPAGSQVRRATLGLWLVGTIYGDAEQTLRVEPLAGAWTEGSGLADLLLDGVAWDGDGQADPEGRGPRADWIVSGRPDLTQPPVAGPAASVRVPAGARDQWVTLDVTPLVQAGAWSFRLAGDADDAPGVKVFASSDHPQAGVRPRLVLEGEGPPPRPPRETPDELDRARARAQALLTGADGAFQAVETAPFWGRALFARGQALLARGHVEPALTDLRRAFQVAEPVGEAEDYATLAEALLAAGKGEEACANLEKGRARFPGDPRLESLERAAKAQRR